MRITRDVCVSSINMGHMEPTLSQPLSMTLIVNVACEVAL